MEIRNPINVAFGKDGVANVNVGISYLEDKNQAILFVHSLKASAFIGCCDADKNDYIDEAIIFNFSDPSSVDVVISQLMRCKQLLIDEDYRKLALERAE